MNINKEESSKEIYDIYDTKGYEHQEVLNEFIVNNIGNIKNHVDDLDRCDQIRPPRDSM